MGIRSQFGMRANFGSGGQINLMGWPSRGGIIVLESASIVDFEFLGFECRKPPPPSAAERDQDAEDQFCQRLLLLGANWYDSETRRHWIVRVEDGDEQARDELEMDRVSEPTYSERRWVKVGWPGVDKNAPDVLPRGGCWVAEHDNGMNYGEVEWDEERCPDELPGLLMLCKDMQERCELLQASGAKFYEKLDDYDGSGFLKAWQEKYSGEVGPLVKMNSFRASTMGQICGGASRGGMRP